MDEPRSSPPDDDVLMARVVQGDEAALRLLVDRWQSRLMSFLLRSTADGDEAEDLAQETFVRLYRTAGRYRGEGRFAPWLFRIAGNLLRSRWRRQRLLSWLPLNRASGALDKPAPARDDPGAQLEATEMETALEDALSKLPPRQRVAVLLKRQQGMSYKEIAEVLETTPAAVESLLVRAQRFLRQELERRGHF